MTVLDKARASYLHEVRRTTAMGLLLAIGGLVVANGMWPTPWFSVPAAIALVLFMAMEWTHLPRVGKVLIAIALGAAVASEYALPNAPAVWLDALERGTFYAAFFVALAFLREPAARSPLVHRCGEQLLGQAPMRRYAAITGGAVLFGMVLNLGALNLLGTMIRRGNTLEAAGGQNAVVQARLRRMGLALYRGFSINPMVSPLSISFIVVVSSLPQVRWSVLLGLGVLTSVAFVLIGWVLDWATRPRHLSPPKRPELTHGAGGYSLKFMGLLFGIFGLAISVELISPLSLPMSLLIAAPVSGLVWMAWQMRRGGPARAVRYTVARMQRRGPRLFTSLRAEVSIISAATFVGVVGTAMLPGDAVAQWLQLLGADDMVLSLMVPPLLMILAIAGINPVLPVVVLVTAMVDGGVYGGPPELLALTFLAGWTLAINISPLIPVVLTLSRVLGVPAGTVSLRWNGLFAIIMLLVVSAWLMLLGSLLGG